MQWLFFTQRLWKATEEYLLVGDEVVVDKAGKETFGLGRFFRAFINGQFLPYRFLLFR